MEGLEGRVLNDVPVARQTAPQLRPGVPENERSEFLGWMKSGKSCHPHQNTKHSLRVLGILFLIDTLLFQTDIYISKKS